MPIANKMIGGKQGQKGKSPRLYRGYKRDSTHEQERNGNKNEVRTQHQSLGNGEKYEQWCEEHSAQEN